MSREKCFKLSPEAQEIWDQLDDHSKSIILAPPGKPPPNQARKVNMHEISAYDYLMANFHLSTDDTDDGPSYVQSEPPDPAPPEDISASDQILVNAAKQSKPAPHPADIRNVLSSKSKMSAILHPQLLKRSLLMVRPIGNYTFTPTVFLPPRAAPHSHW